MHKKHLIIYLFITVTVCAALLLGCRKIGINITKSVPFWIYTINKQSKDFSIGSYILFNLNKDPLKVLPKHAKIVKRIACAPGMNLVTAGDEFTCDGKRIAVRRDKENMKFSFNGIVPERKYFMSGDHFRSYDSRIWGFLDEKDIIAVVYPIF